jgi:hypothetical protein
MAAAHPTHTAVGCKRGRHPSLSEALGVEGIPTLAVLRTADGALETDDAVAKVQRAPDAFPWPPAAWTTLDDAGGVELALGHHHVKWMMDVITGTFTAQQSFKFFCAPRGAGISERFVHCVVHRVISMPSNATSMPCAVKIWRCGLLSSKIGLVLLMWIKIFLT